MRARPGCLCCAPGPQSLLGLAPYSAGERIGKEAYVKAFESFHQAFSDLKMEPTSILSQGDAVAWEYVESATFKAPVLGPGGQTLLPTNRSYRVPVGAFLRINASGLIVEVRVYDNPLLASQQLGMDPTVFLPTKAQDTVKAFIRAFNAHDVDALLALLAPDFGGWAITHRSGRASRTTRRSSWSSAKPSLISGGKTWPT